MKIMEKMKFLLYTKKEEKKIDFSTMFLITILLLYMWLIFDDFTEHIFEMQRNFLREDKCELTTLKIPTWINVFKSPN